MQPSPHDPSMDDRLGGMGCEYYTELTAQYLEDMPEAKLLDTSQQVDRNVVWFEFTPEEDDGPAAPIEMSVSVYPDSPAVTVGADTRIPFHSFQGNAAWILRTCADYGVGIDLEVDDDAGETWMFIFLRIFWAGYNYEVLGAACDDLAECRKTLAARLPIRSRSTE